MDCVILKEKCLNLAKYLKHDILLDLDGLDLFLELNILKKNIGLENESKFKLIKSYLRSKIKRVSFIVYWKKI